ncbi:MAG: hypothetical protein GY794_24475 [bacterium]|nr:hypothetical protein [bacterium]
MTPKRALQQLHNSGRTGESLQWRSEDDQRHITLTATEDLRHRFKFLPREVFPEHGQFVLTDRLDTIKREIARSREDEQAWPKIHYLWPHHPLAEWLAAFGRHTAPVIELTNGLEPGESVFVISGVVPNRKSHPLVNEWLGVRFDKDRFRDIRLFSEVVEGTGLGGRPIPNRGRVLPLADLQRCLPQAVKKAREYVIGKRDAYERGINEKLNQQLTELENLRDRQVRQLELKLESSRQQEGRKAHLKATREQEIDTLFDQYIQWVEDTMTTERQPWLQVVAVLIHERDGG